MFLDNQHTKEYYKIIEKNKIKTAGMSIRKIKAELGYTEKHHIIPRSLKGSDLKENTVYMPATDHFKCHQLLTEMTEGADKGKMWNGLWRMMNKQSRNQDRDFTFNPEDYETARINSAKAHSKRFSGENNSFYNQKHTKESLKSMSDAKKGKSYEKIFGEEYAKEMRLRRSNEQQGKIKGPQDKSTCPHCGTTGGKRIMNRWHFDRCKNNTDVEIA